jgi:hypothetical protein
MAAEEGRFVCRPATTAQATRIQRPAQVTLRPLPEGIRAHAGLNIILNGTAQLDANPSAKAAFERAAAIWEAKIADPVTIPISVDFGPTFFGNSWFPGESGATDADDYTTSYDSSRNLLVSHGGTPGETALYAALPKTSTLPTDVSAQSSATATNAQLHAFGYLPRPGFPAPRAKIGLNSKLSWDFDPSNGISAQSLDFEAIAVHEIGHVLGFISNASWVVDGYSPTIMDFFRFRPTVTMATFGETQRVVSGGGEQVLFGTGGVKTALSTGENGDGEDTSHWKDNRGIGIMDPVIRFGERATLSTTDLDAIDLLGWTLNRTTSTCTTTSAAACLLSDRFRVSVNYRNPFSNPPGATGDFLIRRLNPWGSNPDAAAFGFSDPNAVEVIVRIQDTRPFAPRFDIYFGGMTDVEYWVNVTDTQTSTTRQYHNAPGKVGGGLDRASFPAN